MKRHGSPIFGFYSGYLPEYIPKKEGVKQVSELHYSWDHRADLLVKRHEIRWASLDPVQGAEMAKTRPVVIMSLDRRLDCFGRDAPSQ